MARVNRRRQRIAEELGQYVRDRLELAKEAKQEAYEVLSECLSQVRGDVSDCELLDPDVPINFNITSPIVKGIVGLIRDVFANSIEAPFTIKASPQADLPDVMQQRVLQSVVAQLQTMPMLTPDIVQDFIQTHGQALKNAAVQEQQRMADTAADKMNTIVQDRLRDADWLRQFGDFIYNFVVYPTAILKAPAVKLHPWKRWNGTNMAIEHKLVRGVENISPFDFYPAPNTQSIDTAEYVIEIRKCSRTEMVDSYAAPGFDSDGIRKVLTEYPQGYLEPREDGKDHNPEVSDAETHIGLEEDAQGFYDCVGFYGKIRGELLEEFGLQVGNPDMSYESEIWLVNDIVIKAVLNPDPIGQRPFYAASFEPIPGAFWGECPVTRLRDVQRVCTVTIVSMIRNMGLTSGVLGEVESSRVIDDEDVNVIMPNTIREVKSTLGATGAPAYRFYTVPDISGQLLNVFERFLQYGYEMIGIPRVAFGSTENMGTVGRTSGGIAMVLNQASKSVKFGLRVLEENIIEPVVQSYIDHELMFSLDQTIKGDIRVHARGVSGIVEKENQESKLQWALQSLAPYMQIMDSSGQPLIPPEAIRRLLYQIFKSSGIDTDGIFPDYELQSAVGTDMRGLNPLVQGGTIDGRNASAGEAIANQNGLTANPAAGGM